MAKAKKAEQIDNSQFGEEDEIKSGLFKFEKVGDSIEGVLVDIRTVKSQIDGKDQKMYDIQTAEGEVVAVFGRKIIDQKMRVAKIGNLVKMVFAAEGKPRKKGMSGFKVIRCFVKQAPVSDADEIDPDSEE
ncbi:MAG: hypothetical protein AAB456_00125 [Patescibacteria group bacterium]